MLLIKPQLRIYDDFGAGCYGAPRGDHTHNGNDWLCMPGSTITALRSGIVTKLGYCYSENLLFRYVEIRTVITGDSTYCRYLYVEPTVKLGAYIERGGDIGHAQDVASYHMEGTNKTMLPHVHIETFTLVASKRVYFDSADY